MATPELTPEETSVRRRRNSLKYALYIAIVLVVTAISLTLSLWGHAQEVVDVFAGADWRIVALMIGLVVLMYLIDGLVILVFCRLYTRHYKFHQAVAATLVGQYYSSVTPGSSGGQIMEVYTMRSQGIQISNAASIMVMWFIIYQSTLIGFDVFALAFEWQTVISITATIDLGSTVWVIPMWPLIMVGFALNLFMVLMMYTMSYSHRLHNFVLHYVIGFFVKIKFIKNPDRIRENLRVQVENFRIELKRLQSNIPVVILQTILILLFIFIRCSIPYFAGLSLHAWGPELEFSFSKMLHSAFLSSFHQMSTALIPLPGSAGVSELFYSYLFHDYFAEGLSASMDLGTVIASTQILWRTVTFHLVLIVTALFAALYRSNGQQLPVKSNRQTFIDLQLETLEERHLSADTMYETAQISRRALLARLRGSHNNPELSGTQEIPVIKPERKYRRHKPNVDRTVSGVKRKKKRQEDEWDTLEI